MPGLLPIKGLVAIYMDSKRQNNCRQKPFLELWKSPPFFSAPTNGIDNQSQSTQRPYDISNHCQAGYTPTKYIYEDVKQPILYKQIHKCYAHNNFNLALCLKKSLNAKSYSKRKHVGNYLYKISASKIKYVAQRKHRNATTTNIWNLGLGQATLRLEWHIHK